MDYQFKRDIYGNPIATLSMEHEIIGRWLTDELSGNASKVQRLLTVIEQIENGQRVSFSQQGTDFELNLGPSEVEFEAIERDYDCDQEQMNASYLEANELNTDMASCSCGLVDFKQVVLSWWEYIS